MLFFFTRTFLFVVILLTFVSDTHCSTSSTRLLEEADDIMAACDVSPDTLSSALEVPFPLTCIDMDDNGNDERCWYTYTPIGMEETDDTDHSIPLVIEMHGFSGCAADLTFYTGWTEKALTNNDFVLVLPQGTTDPTVALVPCWNAGNCCCLECTPENENNFAEECSWVPPDPVPEAFKVTQSIDDVAFLKQVIERTVASSSVKIDVNRIYLAGHSNGCMMAQKYASEMSEYIAAVCCHSGVYMGPVDGFPNDDDYHPTPVMIVFGDNDTLVPYGGGSFDPFGTMPSAEDNINMWSMVNECTNYTVINDESGLYATHVYSDCTPENTTVELLQIFDAEHFPFQDFETTVDTTQLAMEFCFQYRNIDSVNPLSTPPPDDGSSLSASFGWATIIMQFVCLSILFM
jgi:polyhydroxybutyrate depolymerase